MFNTSSIRHVQSRTAFIVLVLLLAIFKLPLTASAETLTRLVLDPQNKTIAGAQVRLFDRTSVVCQKQRNSQETVWVELSKDSVTNSASSISYMRSKERSHSLQMYSKIGMSTSSPERRGLVDLLYFRIIR